MHAFYLVWVFCASAELFRRAPVVVAIDFRLTPRMTLLDDISACRLCALRFAATHTGHEPRPIVWLNSSARILIAGQAPGMRVYESGVPFDDRSGERLRNWLGLTPEQFYNKNEVAIVPMAFCFPGYDAQTNDLPPPTICSETWHDKVMEMLPALKATHCLGKVCSVLPSWFSALSHRNRSDMARYGTGGFSLAASVLAQYGVA